MEIERITSEEVVASILGLDDPKLEENVLDKLGCSKIEYVQGLQRYLSSDFLRIYGVQEGKKILAYMVAIKCIDPPFSRYFSITYQNLGDMMEGQKYGLEALEKVKEWADENRCKRIIISVDDEAMARFYSMVAGFKRTGDICMALEW